MKALTIALLKKMTGGVPPQEAEKVMKEMSLSMEDSTEFIVENGMTRSVTGDSRETVKAMGHSISKHEHDQVTIAGIP